MNCNSKTHNLVDADAWRPKSKQWRRRNKTNARVSAEKRQGALRAALAQGNL
jgi:hypothetical protein